MPFKETTKGYTLYTISNDINDKLYIGMTKRPRTRWAQHLREAINGKKSYPIHRAIAKHGHEKFHFDIMEEGLTRVEACHKEIRLIAAYNTRDSKFGYNLAIGGSRVYSELSPEHKIKIGNTSRGRKHTEENKELSRQRTKRLWEEGVFNNINYSAVSGRKPRPIYCHQNGKIYSRMKELLQDLGFTGVSAKEHIYQHLKGAIRYYKKYTFSFADLLNTPEDIKRLSKVWKKKQDEKYKEKSSAKIKKMWTDGVFDNCSFGGGRKAKEVKCLNTGQTFKDVKVMAKELGYSPTAIYSSLRLGTPHHSGLTFTYTQDNKAA